MNRFARFDTPDITICSFRADSGDSQPRGYKLRSPPKLVGAPLYMGFLYGVKIARLDDYMGFLYGAPPDLTVHFWAQKTQNNVSQKAQMLLQKIVTDSLPPPQTTSATTYTVYWASYSNSSATWMNKPAADGDYDYTLYTQSSLILWEIAG